MLNSTVAMKLPERPRTLFRAAVLVFSLTLIFIVTLVSSVTVVGAVGGQAMVLEQATQVSATEVSATLVSPTPASAVPAPAGITLPAGGEALQGVVAVQGRTAVEGFAFAEVAFAYQSDPTNTWFLIQQSGAPVEGGLLANWDTSTITDGDYRLRLQVFQKDGQVQEVLVNGLRVRNYSPVETSTPAPAGERTITPQATPVAPPSPTRTPLSDFQVAARSPTPLPTNPATLSTERLQRSALQGISVVFLALLAGGLYGGLRRLLRK
jgi:hypothetical protein